jgi:hypothetical protein
VELWKTVRKRLHCEKFFLSPTGLAMTDQLMKTITNAQMQWLLAGDPTAPTVLDAHRHAQAAQLALYSIDKIMGDGKQALVELERIQREMGSDD